MTIVLGISGSFRQGSQDGAAALVKDNEIIAAVEEERLFRVKHAPTEMPVRATQYCLDKAGITLREVDYLAYYASSYPQIISRLEEFFTYYFGCCPQIKLVNHHLAHNASALRTSGMKEAMGISFDLSGDGISTLLTSFEDGKIRIVKEYKKPNSLGIYYSLITQHLGFRRDNDEYKVMGLSSYGKDCKDFSWLLKEENGAYELDKKYVKATPPNQPNPSKQEVFYTPEFAQKMGKPNRRLGEPITEEHKDLAASAQRHLERVVLKMVESLKKETGKENICFSGGVALNCVLMQKVWESGLVSELYTSSASSDSGCALGAALQVAYEEGAWKDHRCDTAYKGLEYSNEQIQSDLELFKVNYRETSEPAKEAAQLIADNKIVGWFQERLEYGPRALGNRSILADVRDPKMKDKINYYVKFRESFRPFAPSVLLEKAPEYFENFHESPYMTMTLNVKEDKKKELPAVTHVDGTARLQTVARSHNQKYHELISNFDKLTSLPIVLNTSFNVKGQPIVNNPKQAISTFFGTGMDALVIGNFIVEK